MQIKLKKIVYSAKAENGFNLMNKDENNLCQDEKRLNSRSHIKFNNKIYWEKR